MNTDVLLGDINFCSSQTTHKVMVLAKGFTMRWYVTVTKKEDMKYVKDVWCLDNYQEEYRNLKKSVKNKIRKMIESQIMTLKSDELTAIEKICDSSIIQKIRATKTDAEARRIIRTSLSGN